MKLLTCFSILLTINSVVGWDSEELELFDLVEEINENFYDVLGVAKVLCRNWHPNLHVVRSRFACHINS